MKKVLVLLLVLALTAGCIGITGASEVKASENDLTQDNMTEVLKKVKSKVDIAEEYEQFDYTFREENGEIIWRFTWSTADDNRRIRISSDGEGRIISYNSYTYNEDTQGYASRTAAEQQIKAEQYIKKLLPETAGKLELQETTYNFYNGAYSYNYSRIENELILDSNYVYVTVDADDGKLLNLNCEWLYDAEFPKAENLISEEKAADIIGKKLKLELRYCLAYKENAEGEYEESAFLAYVPDMDYIAVDAVTGEIYTENIQWSETGARNAEASMAVGEAKMEEDSATANFATVKLTDAELEKIEQLPEFITKEEVIDILKDNKSLLIDDNAQSVSAYLNKYDSEYVWRITMSDNRPIDYETNDTFRAYISASVNAVTGEIKSFYSSVKSLYEYTEEELAALKTNYTKNQCRKIIAGFFNEINGKRFANTRLTETGGSYAIGYKEDETPIYGGYSFNYTRVNEEIPLYANYLSGSVDAVSGKIYSYNCNWNDELVLPTAKGSISAAEAMKAYLGFDGYGLVYEINTIYGNNTMADKYMGYDVKKEIRLVYLTNIYPKYVDAFTGKQLTYSGEEYSEEAENFEYSDIAGTKYEREIILLANMGVGFKATEFKPNQAITRAEFQELLDSVGSIYMNDDLRISGDKELTRQYAAKTAINALGLGEIAELGDIFKTGYSDESRIAKGYAGYVALAKGYGITGASGERKFAPKTVVTRGEAALILLQLMSAR